jgi:hypothetical protein
VTVWLVSSCRVVSPSCHCRSRAAARDDRGVIAVMIAIVELPRLLVLVKIEHVGNVVGHRLDTRQLPDDLEAVTAGQVRCPDEPLNQGQQPPGYRLGDLPGSEALEAPGSQSPTPCRRLH